jgi:hypothetical protein
VPEFSRRISRAEQLLYGPDARNCQVIADNLLFGVEYVAGAAVQGDIAEFGSMTGRTATVLAAAMASFQVKRRLHLFDSFEGLPEATTGPDQSSFHVKDGVWSRGACRGIRPAILRAKCTRYLADDQVLIYEGWFRDTLPRIPKDARMGLLHVDSDLYQSAIEVLDFVFQRGIVSEGAIVLFDDWNCNRAANDLGERRAWQEVVTKYKIEFSDLGSYSWAGHRFIVHGYSKGSVPAIDTPAV